MSLPQLNLPEFELNLPSSGQAIRFHPFTVAQQKLLLIAQEGQDIKEVITAVKNMISQCLIGSDVDVGKLPAFDLEYVFCQIRSKSVGEVLDLRVHHQEVTECKHIQDVQVAIDDIKVTTPENHTNPIILSDGLGIEMSYPNIETVEKIQGLLNNDSETQTVFALIGSNIKTVFQGDTVYDQFTPKEVEAWLETMQLDDFIKVGEFFNTMPALEYMLEYTCDECHKKESIRLVGLSSFFT